MSVTKMQAEKEIEFLSEKINYHREKYYLEDSPEISDAEFDALME